MSTIQRAAALGFFDGVHIGHAALMRHLVEVCSNTSLTPAVITFDTLPQNMLEGKVTYLINSQEDKVGLIRRLFGIDDIIILPFDAKTAQTPYNDFIDRLVIEYNVRHFVVGRNFRFGKGAEGNRFLLRRTCAAGGLGCDVISDVKYDGIVSSSTHIRQLLTKGDIERANAFLGHPHVLTSVVRCGQQLGSKLGVPTLNMSFGNDLLIPAHGVYATKVFTDSDAPFDGLTGVTNIGVRPTVDTHGTITAETHIPRFSKNLYGCEVRIEFHRYLRPEIKFGSLDELKAQIERDCKMAIEYFASCQ